MCGRYTLFVPPADPADRFDIRVQSYQSQYNATPGQTLPIITDDEPGRLRHLEWRFIPTWADEKSDGGHINARAETLSETASFWDAFAQHGKAAGRCLVPAIGFYEWTETDGGK
jgi:putative SOS response-associated peptidase YedK